MRSKTTSTSLTSFLRSAASSSNREAPRCPVPRLAPGIPWSSGIFTTTCDGRGCAGAASCTMCAPAMLLMPVSSARAGAHHSNLRATLPAWRSRIVNKGFPSGLLYKEQDDIHNSHKLLVLRRIRQQPRGAAVHCSGQPVQGFCLAGAKVSDRNAMVLKHLHHNMRLPWVCLHSLWHKMCPSHAVQASLFCPGMTPPLNSKATLPAWRSRSVNEGLQKCSLAGARAGAAAPSVD